MDSTPPRSKLSCKSVKTGVKKESEYFGTSEPLLNTPTTKTNLKNDQENDYSPIYFPTTQESNEDIDVFWDWHSPQTSERQRKKHKKRLIPVQSPNFPIKRHPSKNMNENFEKLRNELKLLQEQLAEPDDENCLCVSPQQEMEFKHDNHIDNSLQLEKQHQSDNFNDLFDDSVDEQLVLFSQKIEKDLIENEKKNQVINNKHNSIFTCDNSDIDNLLNKYAKNQCNKIDNQICDESFSKDLNSFNVQEVRNTNNNTIKNTKGTFHRTYSDDSCNKSARNVIQTMSGKLELHRTKSFELDTNSSHISLSKSKLEEIERKRLEALAKLTSKKKQENSKNGPTQLSPQKCSPEEIERKRLQALAKREAKRLEEIVEKKRQEALKRLQASRMKNANLVKSTLTTRL